MPMKNKRLTLKDIAGRAGVSLTAASMYMNGKAKQYNLADSTCERIEKVIRKYNFIPNFHARAIASKRTFLVGVQICDSLDTSFWLKIISGTEEKLADSDYHMIFSVSHFSAEKEMESIRFMANKGIDGLIIAPVGGEKNNHDYLRKLDKSMPVVTINSKVEGISAAYNDNYAGGRIASEFLVGQGHRKIAYIGDWETSRGQSFLDAMRKAGMRPGLFQDVPGFMRKAVKFTAAFCYSDVNALELYNEANARGMRIPEDISVIGYDNMDFVKLMSPRPVTIGQYKKKIGTAAAEIMMSRIGGAAEVPDRVFTPVLCEGESVKRIP